eukprot:TRINITY_DN5750_c0_g1_i1.p1 TRINITY_DN5750_c0_g1~~TRINITY_DN5750_c0_g1_i1.p1  ORF type:complete len:358 (+),score=56.30 TRINITY_DN5750_c0_g1_i1:183-1256(+)
MQSGSPVSHRMSVSMKHFSLRPVSTSFTPAQVHTTFNSFSSPSSLEIEEVYTDPTHFPCPIRFDKIVPMNEQYITHALFKKFKDNTEKLFILLLTTTRYYKISVDSFHQVWSRDLIDLHAIEGDDASSAATPTLLRLVCRVAPKSSREPRDSSVRNRMSVEGPLTYGLMDKNLLKPKSYHAESIEVRDHWLIALRVLLRDMWQQKFESTLILSPDIYQTHVYVDKINRHGKNQVRCVLLSIDRLFNVMSKGMTEIGKVKWSFPHEAMSKLDMYANPPNLLDIHVDSSNKGVRGKVKNVISLAFKDKLERDMIVAELRRLYFNKTKKHLSKVDIEDEWGKDREKTLRAKFGKLSFTSE